MGGQTDELAKAIAACVRRDRSGLRAIFDQDSGRLLAVAHRILRRRELAEEVLQEALIRIWTHAHQYAPDQGSAKGWIYAIVRNRAFYVLRDGKREQTVDDVDALCEAEHSNDILTAWHQLDQTSICLGQGRSGSQSRLSRSKVFARTMIRRMMAVMATFLAFPTLSSC